MKTVEMILRDFGENEETGVLQEQLIGWIMDVEQELAKLRKEKYGIETDLEDMELTHEVSVPAPFDTMFVHYLHAMSAYRNGEVVRYNNAMAMYQKVMSEYRAWLLRNNMPVQIKATYF